MSTVEQVVVLAGFAVTVIGLVWALSSRGRAFRKRYPNLTRLAITVLVWLAWAASVVAIGVLYVKVYNLAPEVAVLSCAVLVLTEALMFTGSKYWDVRRQLDDLKHRHECVRTDRDNWKATAHEAEQARHQATDWLARAVVAANTAPAPTSPTNNETSVA